MKTAIWRLQGQVVALATACGHLARGLVAAGLDPSDVRSHLDDIQTYLPVMEESRGRPVVKMIVSAFEEGSPTVED
jgi:hypothetical protein